MSTSIEAKLRIAASADATLPSLLGTTPFRWYDTQLVEGSAYPAMVCLRVSDVPTYVNQGQNPMELVRIQITIWEGQTAETTDALINALENFLATFSATSVIGYASNRIVNKRRGFFAQTQPGIFQNIIDVMIWNNKLT
jgi:hypothetical protein